MAGLINGKRELQLAWRGHISKEEEGIVDLIKWQNSNIQTLCDELLKLNS